MKQTKTRRALLIVTLMMLVLTLGFGLLFMQREKASADESASELIPLADAELQATGAYMAGSEGVWWDSPTTGTQVRLLFWKVSSGDPVRLSAGASNHYNADPNIELTIDDGTLQTKTLADWNLKDTHSAWVDNMAAHNGDTSVGEIWVCSNHEFLTKIKEVHVKPGFAQRDASGAETNVKATKDYYLWNADTKGWQTRITSFTATYDGTLEQDGALNPAKLNITAQFKDGTSGTVDGTLITVGELDTSDLGTKQVTLTYQDKTFDLSVTVEEKRTLTSISVEDISARRWTYITNDDLVVKAHYGAEDEEGEQLSPVDFTITEAPDMWTTGETATGKVSYTHNEVTKDATFTVNVQDNTTTDKYLDVVPGKSFNGTNGGGQDGTGFMFGDRALLSVPIKIVGFDLGYALGSRNSIGFELIKGMHFVDYIDFVYDGSPKTLQELLTDGTIKSAGTSDNGVLVFWFVDAANRAKVSQIHCKAGMQWPKQVGDHWSALEEGQNAVTAASELLSDLVLKHDVYLENNGAQGWLKVIETLTATPTEQEVVQGTTGDELKSNLTVEVQYKGETAKTSVEATDYTVEIDTSEVSDSVEGTVTYRGKTAKFTVKVVAPAKILDRIELSGTTEFTGKRFEAAPELTGFTVTAHYEGEKDEGTVLEAGKYTVGTVDMWDTVGDHNIKVSYTEAGKTVEANLKLTIEAPDMSKGLVVVTDNTPSSDWQPTPSTQLLFYFKMKGDVTPPTRPAAPDTTALHTGNHIQDYLIIDGKEYSEWSSHVAWVGMMPNRPTGSAEDVYELWLCTKESDTDKEWKAAIKTVTLKAGFQWSANSALLPGLILKEDVTLWNAHEAGWQQKATSLEASVKQGADLTAGANINDILDVKAVYGTENKKAITGYTVEGYDKSKTVAQTVTVKYQDVQTTVEVTLTAPASVPEEITLDKNTLTVNQFELADFSAITATVKFTGDKADVTFKLNALPTQATLSAIDTWEKGEKKVTLTYSEGGVDITVEITVTVGDPDTTKGLKVLHDYAENAAKTWWWSQPAPQTSQMLIYFDVFGEGVAEIDTDSAQIVFEGKEHVDNYILINGQPFSEWSKNFPAPGWYGTLYNATPYKMDGRIDAHTLWFDPSYAAGYATMSEWRDTVKTVTIKAGFQWYDKNGPVAGAVVKEDITIYNAQSSWQRLATDIEVAKKADAKILVGTEDIRPMLDVKAVYSETDKQAVPGYTIEGYKKDTVGKQTITIKFQTFEKPLEIEVEEEKVKVKFDLNGGTGIPEEQEIVKGSKLTRPATDPTREGYTFDGWFTSKNGGSEYDFNAPVNDELTIFAQWVENTTPGGDTPTTPGGDTPTTPDTPAEEEGGCGSVIEGPGIYVGMALMLGATVAIVLAVRRKRD